ncbi:MAG TPA: nucleotidyltransferase family protein [Chitinophagales bacterium]|nr:nucleotidyltransferase family protein [Chitinophagales bacterium]HRG87186.1 nucleotidyltransferase family protein [Chitinophagales bacterium]HRH53822.1 nucleotidyltransferase family protein [Chitinophagales bacterium]
MIREAIVLAGGFGTRLQTVVKEVPKPMAPVAGKPFLQYILDYLIAHKVAHVVLAVGYLRETIIDYFGDNYQSLSITYAVEENPLGTGGGILNACNQIKGDNVFVINGDTFFDVDLVELSAFHETNNALLTVALKKMEKFDRYGTVETDNEGRIIGFLEKKYLDEGLINGGIYCLNKHIFHPELPAAFSFEKEILEKEIVNRKIYGLRSEGYFIDIGIPEDYARAQDDFKGK